MAAPKPNPIKITPPQPTAEQVAKAMQMIDRVCTKIAELMPAGATDKFKKLAEWKMKYKMNLDQFFKEVLHWLKNEPLKEEYQDTNLVADTVICETMVTILFQQIDLYADDSKFKYKPAELILFIDRARSRVKSLFNVLHEYFYKPQTHKDYGQIKEKKPEIEKQARFGAFGDYMTAYYVDGNDMDYYQESARLTQYGDGGYYEDDEYGVYDDGMKYRYYALARNGDYGGLYNEYDNEYDNGYRYNRKLRRNGDFGRRQRKLLEISETEGFMQDSSAYTLITALCIGFMILFCIIGVIIYRWCYKNKGLRKVKMTAMDGIAVKGDEESIESSKQAKRN